MRRRQNDLNSFFPAFLVSPNLTASVNENFNEVVGKSLMLDVTASDPDAILDATREFYLGNETISRETQENFTNIFTGRYLLINNSPKFRQYHPPTIKPSFQIGITFIPLLLQQPSRVNIMDVETKCSSTTLIGKLLKNIVGK